MSNAQCEMKLISHYSLFISHHSHPIGNMLKTIDFIGDFELHDSKKWLIPSHSTKKRQKRPIFEGFCGIPVG